MSKILEVDWVSQESVGDCTNPDEPNCNGAVWRITYTNGEVHDVCRDCGYTIVINKEENKMRYKNINQIRTTINNSTYENRLSHSEKTVFQALDNLDDTLAWRLYIALSDFIDKFLI